MKTAYQCAFICVLAAIPLVSGWYWGDWHAREGLTPDIDQSAYDSLASLESENRRLAGEVEDLRSRLQAADGQVMNQRQGLDYIQSALSSYEDPRNVGEHPPSAPGLSIEEAREVSQRMEEARQRVEAYAAEIDKRLRENPNLEDFQTPLVEAYEAEPVDPDWAAPKEQLLQEAFAAETMQDVVLRSVECRSTGCRVRFDYQNTDEVADVMHRLGAYSMQPGNASFFPHMSANYRADGLAELYFLSESPFSELPPADREAQ